MALALTDLIKDLDPDEELASFLALGDVVGLSTGALEPGDLVYDVADTITTWWCALWNRYIAPAIRAQFLDYASGDWLTFSAWSRYNRPRAEETFATGTTDIENRGGWTGPISAGQIRIRQSSSKTYTNTTGGFLAPWSGSGAYPTLELTFQADEAGTGSNAAASSISAYPTALVAGPAGLYAITNTSAWLGSDAEEDPALKERCRLAVTELGQGPRAEYVSIALDPVGAFTRRKRTPPSTWGTTPINVNRVRVLEDGDGVIRVIVAAPSGAASGDSVTADTDVYKAHVALLAFAVAPGATLTTETATEHAISYGTITVYVDRASNVSKLEAETRATTALTAFFKLLAIGGARTVEGGTGYVYLDHVKAVAQLGAGVISADVSGSDVALADDEVAVASFTVVAQLVTQ